MLIPFVAGVGVLTTKTIKLKIRKPVGVVLIIVGLINIGFAAIAMGYGTYQGIEILGLLLYFLLGIIPFIFGFILKKKELNENIKNVFGALLVILSIAFFLFINTFRSF